MHVQKICCGYHLCVLAHLHSNATSLVRCYLDYLKIICTRSSTLTRWNCPVTGLRLARPKKWFSADGITARQAFFNCTAPLHSSIIDPSLSTNMPMDSNWLAYFPAAATCPNLPFPHLRGCQPQPIYWQRGPSKKGFVQHSKVSQGLSNRIS